MTIEELKNNILEIFQNDIQIKYINSCFEEYDKSNNQFGNLRMIEKYHRKQGKQWMGLYRCYCGKIKEIQNVAVKSGRTKSCGCSKNN